MPQGLGSAHRTIVSLSGRHITIRLPGKKRVRLLVLLLMTMHLTSPLYNILLARVIWGLGHSMFFILRLVSAGADQYQSG